MSIPVDQPFVLICTVQSQGSPYAIQANPSGGFGLTLQPFDSSFNTPTQQFVARMQNNVDTNGNVIPSGIAFVNLGSFTGSAFNSVTFQSNRKPLIMESWSASSQDQDAWSVDYIEGQGIQIGLPSDTNVRWNDFGGNGNLNDPIYAWDGPGQNTVWQVVLAPQQPALNADATLETADAAR
ncbi:MAG TPA: hypothetical protein VFK06_22570 [Candidatus Angelobacter sp.]|nr:hypothetical protein [Candidatus Angelobacter sp.]